ncbi:glycerol kinase [Microlunatus sagamiharensis]|uniref:Glycerol kinase n=1 Tax=Microlunatus sagamiharensis TaxID=546874 RepID=A0A1H2NEE4_9ACTN|nr:FGGY family carbohydrate kinase [Microlunatus sagamiharensis]SDV03176.1 glycerol kinase [Microlunatus sagamiharensis]
MHADLPAPAVPTRRADGLLVAVDQGTSATKAVVVDLTGAVVARASVPLAQQFPRPGWAEQDALEIWASVQESVRQALDGLDPAAVVAVGLSTQRESMLLWDRATGEPRGPVLGWQDTRGAEQCARLRSEGRTDRVRALTGLPLDAMFSASKASALLDAYDPDRSASRRGELCLGTVDSWLLWRIGGEHLVEAGNASRTQLLDLATRTWDPWLLDLFDVPLEALPRVVASSGPFVACRDLAPLAPDVPVTGVLGDSHAALFAHAGWQPGRVKVTYGTGSSVMAVSHTPTRPSTGVAKTIAWELDAPAYALEGNIRSSGATLGWLGAVVGRSPAEVAAAAGPSSDGVVLVPAFTGLGAPWWDDQARATITGISAGTRLEHLARAGLEAITSQIEDVIAAAEEAGDPIGVILADGGPSANADLMQLQADTSGRDVAASQVAELSALGAAHLAGLGAGVWTLDDLDALPRERTTYAPRSSPQERDRRRHTWHAAVAGALGTAAVPGTHLDTPPVDEGQQA